MSLRAFPGSPIPEDTVRVARAAFPKGNRYMQMHDALGSIYSDGQFAGLFSQTGQPAEAPARLALVLVLQFAEGLSDRQAADAVRGRIDPEVIRRETALYIHRSRCLSEQVFGRFIDLFSLPPKRAALRSR